MAERKPTHHGHHEPDGAEPSMLFSFWPEDQRPIEEEIRLALEARWPGLSKVDELEQTQDLLFGSVLKPPDGGPEFTVWAEVQHDLGIEFLEDGLGPSAELDLARKSKWMIGVEMMLDGRDPAASFQRQMGILADATVPGLAAVYDDNAVIVRSGRQVLDIVRCPVPPRPHALYAIHTVESGKELWIHTHGLRRAGLPEIDVLGIREREYHGAQDLIAIVAEALLSGTWPDSEGRLDIGRDVAVRALSLDAAMLLVPVSFPGGRADREGDMADHGGNRLILFDAKHPRAPVQVIRSLEKAGVIYQAPRSNEGRERLSKDRFGIFGQVFAIHRREDWRFHAKFGFPRLSEPTGREHLWFEVLELRPGNVRGRLINDPVDVSGLVRGATSWEPLERLTDWLIVTPYGAYDAETAGVLLDG